MGLMVRWEWKGNGNKKVIPAHLYLKVSRLDAQRMSAGSAFQARGSATESACAHKLRYKRCTALSLSSGALSAPHNCNKTKIKVK